MRRRMGGYLTLEFTLLLPVLIMVFLLVTEAGLYFYNRCLLRENAQILALQLIQEETASLTEEGLSDHVSGLAQYKYLLLREVQTRYSKDGSGISVTISGKMYNFCSAAGIGDTYLTLQEEATCRVMDKTGILGTIRAVKRKIDANSKGVDS
ncbi:MAG: pilus assembly protein [Lachnospiraceae bacterium]|nr:pilus assembly protein [Lachnospiraceae bacterium]